MNRTVSVECQAIPVRIEEGRLHIAMIDPTKPIVLSGSAGRMQFPPAGIFGGGAGGFGRIEIDGTPIAPTSSPEVIFTSRDVVRLVLPGGGGYGSPRERDRALVESDLRNGYVTPDGAKREYGWTSRS